MATYSDAELQQLMVELESDLVEREESAVDGKKIRRNIRAFANDLPGNGRPGVVLVGVRDDGTCASLPIDDELLARLSNIHGEGDILPLPSMTVQKRHLNGCEVAVVAVEPSADPPVRYRGRVRVRVGPSVREGSDDRAAAGGTAPIEERESTCVLGAGDRATVDAHPNRVAELATAPGDVSTAR